MASQELLNDLQGDLAKLKNPVRLILFTRDVGCEICPDVLNLVKNIKQKGPRIALELYDHVMDRDKSAQYGVKYVPAVVVQGANGRFVNFYGRIDDVFLKVLLDTILAVSDGKKWFPDNIHRTLTHLEQEVAIQVFVESDCVRCRPVAETAVGLALESNLITADIIIASDFPDLIKKYSIKTLPKTIFGANLHMDGHVTETEFLEMIFQAEGVQTGPDRRCLVCGNPTSDMICGSCKTRIQAEAVDHKRKGEKLRRAETA